MIAGEGHRLNEGALAPVADEVSMRAELVEGVIPRGLNGTLLRNGPNPFNGTFAGNDMLDWWPEAAMLHSITLNQGRPARYTNRWIRTVGWADYHQKEAAHLVASNPNVAVIQHAGSILALAEGGPPVCVTEQGATLGLPTTHQAMHKGASAHPKIDPDTQTLMSFRSSWENLFIDYSEFSPEGDEQVHREIPLDQYPEHINTPPMTHDMAITEHHSVLFDLAVGYDFSMLEHGFRIPIQWQPDRGARFCIVPRPAREGENRVHWVEIEPCFIQHVINAYEPDHGRIILDVVRYPWFLKLDNQMQMTRNPLGIPWRYEIDLTHGRVSETELSDHCLELPRINDRYTGRAYRYFYAAAQPSDVEMRGVVRFDVRTGTLEEHFIPPGDQNSEPIFVPHPDGREEDDGWVLVCVYRRKSHTSELLVLNAQDISGPPIARLTLNRRIPAGFHGAWVATPT
ncbi:MAG: carotenoid oxygenase family protein [Pseudomonadota bacterium]